MEPSSPSQQCLPLRSLSLGYIGAVSGFGTLPDGRYFKRDLNRPANPEVSPRDAKAWLRENLRGYRETTDQKFWHDMFV